jgi:hypothetical protein
MTSNNEEEIEWFIDRTPDFNITTSLGNLTIDNDFDYTNNDYNQPILNETEVRKISVSEEEQDCPICFETREIEEISQVNCGHKFCTICLTKYIRTSNSLACCPLCRGLIIKITFQTPYYEFYFLDS